MASEKILEQKKALVVELTERLQNSISGIVVKYEGITVEDDTKLRKELREAGVNYTVVKNTMLSRAADNAGLADMKGVLEGTTALATCDDDYVAPARILCKFADTHENFEVKTGYMDNDIIDMDKIQSLAKLPTREVLLANVLGAFQAPIASFARAVQAIVDKGGVEACEPAAEEAAPAEEAAE
ncbi:MAG: 50S ribosomal protein L10 [Acutalibacteraceae bacterium]|nr:50S ribosomal protein L10 [Acutalibacteraceae bacterium]